MCSLAPRAVLSSTIATRDLREKRDEARRGKTHAPFVAPFSPLSRVTRHSKVYSWTFSFR